MNHSWGNKRVIIFALAVSTLNVDVIVVYFLSMLK